MIQAPSSLYHNHENNPLRFGSFVFAGSSGLTSLVSDGTGTGGIIASSCCGWNCAHLIHAVSAGLSSVVVPRAIKDGFVSI